MSGSYDQTLKLWNLEDGNVIRTFEGHTDAVRLMEMAMLSLFRVAALEDWSDIMHIDIFGCGRYGYDQGMRLARASARPRREHRALPNTPRPFTPMISFRLSQCY